jgi:PAS domain S-box-containing protein
LTLTLRRTSQWIAALVTSAGSLVVLTWLAGGGERLTFGAGQVPTAPATGLLAALFGAALLLGNPTRAHSGDAAGAATGDNAADGSRAATWRIATERALALVTLILAIAFVSSQSIGYDLSFERWLSGTSEIRNGTRIGRTSLVTALMFAALAVALLLRSPLRAKGPQSAIITVVLGASVVFLQGYLLGAPLLYGGHVIPVAAPTAIVVLLSSLAALLQLGADAWPMRLFVPNTRMGVLPSRSAFIWLALFLSGVVLTSGFFWNQGETHRNESTTTSSLSTIVDLKSRELANWYRGHRSTAVAVSMRMQPASSIVALAGPSATDAQRRALLDWLATLQLDNDFERVELFDAAGRSVAFVGRDSRDVAEDLRQQFNAMPQSDTVIVHDLYHRGTSSRMVFWAPLPSNPGVDARAGAWVAMVVNVERSLFPLLRDLPVAYRTGDYVLWHITPDSLHLISPNPAVEAGRLAAGFTGAIAVTDSSTPAALAIRGGGSGTFQAVDFRGVPVRAAVRVVPGTDWMLVAKIESAEIREPVLAAALRATVISLILLIGIAAIFYALWYRRDLARTERELRLVADRERAAEDYQRHEARYSRLIRVRSGVNQALVRAELEEELFQIICDIAVNDGGYRMAWIGLKEHDAAHSITPVAIAGEERGYLRDNPITWGEDERGRGPTGRCFRSGEPQVAQGLLQEHDYAPWREAARERGYQSSISVPLTVGSEVIGGFMLYAAEPNAFDADEFSLIVELGRDISFGVAVLRDHRTLDAQREQLTLFRQAIDRSTDAIFVADVATGHFLDFNAAALEQLGYTDAQMREIGPADVVVDFGPRGGMHSVAAAVKAAGGLVRPSIHRRRDGTEVPVEVALAVFEVGQRTVMLGIARDVSERVELQAQLMRAQKMESVGRLAGGVAHDFNNLLTVITTSADLALAEVTADTAIYHDIKEIRSAGERAARLTRQLLAFSRQQVLKREVLDVNEVVTRFLTMLARVIGEDVHLELQLGPIVPPIFADAGQLEQVLMNLCVNARDAMPRGGTLTIGTGTAKVDEDHAARREGMTAGEYITLFVTDTGVGMDKATQAKIFEPFFTTKEQGRGTGLGLSTVYGIVKQSGGSVWCYSEIGIGTTFRIYLPVSTATRDTEQSSAPSRSLSAGKETVLIVEDEDSIRFVARRVLERSGYTVLEADSGAAALDVLATHTGSLDLVLTDLVMPGMTGIELSQELRKTRPDLKMLFTSGYSVDVVSDRFHPDGEWNFISKPYGVRELVEEVRRVLDS